MPGHQDSRRSNHAIMSIPVAGVWQGARIIECVPFHDAGLHFFRFSSCKRYHIGGSELDSLGFAEHGQIRESKESIVFLCPDLTSYAESATSTAGGAIWAGSLLT
jgi:putative component of membrane protein insertase Oxa1/YidC/SpoIIIJ protein YidD